jgi:hypothetical protein
MNCSWGTTRTIPAYCFVLEVERPDCSSSSITGATSQKVCPRGCARRRQIKLVGGHAPACRTARLCSLRCWDSSCQLRVDSVNVLIPLAVSMRAHKRGGILLVVPAGTESWRESIVRPIPRRSPQLSVLVELLATRRTPAPVIESLGEFVDAIASLTLSAAPPCPRSLRGVAGAKNRTPRESPGSST